MLREMASTYGRSPGGYAWAVLSPLGAVVLMAFAFSFMLRSPSLGSSFVLFYATGYLPFDLYSQLQRKIGASLKFSRPLLAYPGVGWAHAVIARFLLNTLTLLTVFCIVIAGILVAVETQTLLRVLPILEGLAMVALLGLGVGLINCLLMGLFDVWERVWPILSRPLFLASAIFYIYEDVPAFAKAVLWWNPIVHAVGTVRTGFYPTYDASYVSPAYAFGLPLALIVAAMLFLRRYYRRALER